MAKKAPIRLREKVAAEIKAKMDGWKNVLTGIGVKGKDRRMASKIEWEPLVEEEADEFYAGSDIARKVVDEVIEDAFREGYELQSEDIDPDALPEIVEYGKELQINEKLAEAWRLARMYGGSAIIPVPRDPKLLTQPFVPEKLQKIESLLVLSRWELPRQMTETDIRLPNFAHPKSYRICPRTGADQMNFEVHHSWVLRFDGSYLPRIKFFKNNLWHDSILNVCKTPIRDYDAALASVSATLDDFSVGVMKMNGLKGMIADDRDDLVTKRLEIANLSRSVAKMIILDADNEDFQYQDRQLSGVADAVRAIAGRLVVASGMPHTKILGESPEGSQATGNSTTKDWYDHVHSQQENYLDPRLLKLWGWALAAKTSPTKGKVPNWKKTEYAALWQEPESVQADMRQKQAQTDASYIANGVLEPAEVAISRFGTGSYSTQTQLIDDRTTAADVATKKLNDPDRLDPPPPEADPNAEPEKTTKTPYKPNQKATSEVEEREADV